jgi:hypothetical protein
MKGKTASIYAIMIVVSFYCIVHLLNLQTWLPAIICTFTQSKIIAPTISLNSGKIVYDYYLNLDDTKSNKQLEQSNRKVNSSLRAHVDPTRGIVLKWTDGIRGGRGGSCWVTECRVPVGTLLRVRLLMFELVDAG